MQLSTCWQLCEGAPAASHYGMSYGKRKMIKPTVTLSTGFSLLHFALGSEWIMGVIQVVSTWVAYCM